MNYFSRTLAEKVVISYVVAESHVGVPLVRKHPASLFTFQNNAQMISVFKHKRREYAKPVVALVEQPNLRANFPLKFGF